MLKAHHAFNTIVYTIVIVYILFINYASYYHTGTGLLNFFISLFQNQIFRAIFLLIIAYLAFDMCEYGGFTLAILLTIAFLNSSMISTKKVQESFDATENGDMVADMQQSDDEDNMESFDASGSEVLVNTNQSGDAPNCGPYADYQRLPFNPMPYRPDESVLDSGAPDALPEDSVANGPYTTSGVGYEFNMA